MQLHKIEMTTAVKCLNLLPMVEKTNSQQDFASRLKTEMARKGFKVKDLSQACDVTYEMARRYTLGTAKPREDKLAKISDWLGVEPAWLEYGAQPLMVPPEMELNPLPEAPQSETEIQGINDFSNLSEDEKRLLRVFRQYPYIEARNMLLAFEARFNQVKERYGSK